MTANGQKAPRTAADDAEATPAEAIHMEIYGGLGCDICRSPEEDPLHVTPGWSSRCREHHTAPPCDDHVMRDMSNGARKSGTSPDDVASKVAKTVHTLEANTPETDEIR